MPVSFTKSDAYVQYESLSTRPKGMKPWDKESDGIVICAGEKFCRVNIGNGQLCEINTRFSTTGNLRTHVKGHKVEIAEVRKGTLTAEEHREVKRFYEAIMLKHQQMVNAETQLLEEDNGNGSRASTPLSPIVETPRKGPTAASTMTHKNAPLTVLVRRPHAPRKADGSFNITQMRRDAGIKGTKKCEGCRELKRSCPGPDDGCAVMGQYTDDSDDDDEDGEEDDDEEVGSP